MGRGPGSRHGIRQGLGSSWWKVDSTNTVVATIWSGQWLYGLQNPPLAAVQSAHPLRLRPAMLLQTCCNVGSSASRAPHFLHRSSAAPNRTLPPPLPPPLPPTPAAPPPCSSCEAPATAGTAAAAPAVLPTCRTSMSFILASSRSTRLRVTYWRLPGALSASTSSASAAQGKGFREWASGGREAVANVGVLQGVASGLAPVHTQLAIGHCCVLARSSANDTGDSNR